MLSCLTFTRKMHNSAYRIIIIQHIGTSAHGLRDSGFKLKLQVEFEPGIADFEGKHPNH